MKVSYVVCHIYSSEGKNAGVEICCDVRVCCVIWSAFFMSDVYCCFYTYGDVSGISTCYACICLCDLGIMSLGGHS